MGFSQLDKELLEFSIVQALSHQETRSLFQSLSRVVEARLEDAYQQESGRLIFLFRFGSSNFTKLILDGSNDALKILKNLYESKELESLINLNKPEDLPSITIQNVE